MDKHYYVYILTNQRNTVLYTGVTNDLVRKVYEHKEKLAPGFTKKYNVNKLVYYEMTESIESAITRDLINGMNPVWKDLYDDL
jgi:putative endonuclease